MQIDNIEEAKTLLADIQNLFLNITDIKKNLEKQISIKNDETIDYLHELEISKLNAIELNRTIKALIKTRKDRRILKDKLELIKILKGYTDKYIMKGIVGDTKQAITNIDMLKKHLETRTYIPKVIKNLKCAKNHEGE